MMYQAFDTISRIRNALKQPLMVLACLMLALLSGCQTIAPSASGSDAPSSDQAQNILIVNSNLSIERYRVAEQAFRETLTKTQGKQPNVFSADLSTENNPIPLLQDTLNHGSYDRIYCIGAKALGSIDYINPKQPVVFSSVLNWQRFQNQSGISGVASDIAVASQFTILKHFFPDVQSVGVIYSQSNQGLIKQAQQAANAVDLKLELIKIDSPTHALDDLQELASGVDVLWLLPDPLVISSTDQAKALFTQADQLKLPIFTTNRLFKALGATLTISADLPTVGRQAAMLMQTAKHLPEDTIHYPVGSHITLNLKKVAQYKLELNYQALDSVNELQE